MARGSDETEIRATRFCGYTGKYIMHYYNTMHEDHYIMARFDIQA